MMANKELGIIVGTSFHFSELLKNTPVKTVSTPFGTADIAESGPAVIAFRHGRDSNIPSHRINHPANLRALKDAGVRCVVGFQSVGSLKQSLPPGSLLVPHDYISLFSVPTIFENNRDPHIVPAFDRPLRKSVTNILRNSEIPVFERGVYWQTQGPRFETSSEIQLLSHFADCVGMTAASEATIAQETRLPYCCICSVDNFAHGIGSPPLTEDMFLSIVKKNTQMMEKVFKLILENVGELSCQS